MELGPLQNSWVSDLRKYPERQATGKLGYKADGKIMACCLGQLCLTTTDVVDIDLLFENDELMDNSHDILLSDKTKELIGIYGRAGEFMNDFKIIGKDGEKIDSLALMNDNGFTWEEIANFIENNPSKIFIKSV